MALAWPVGCFQRRYLLNNADPLLKQGNKLGIDRIDRRTVAFQRLFWGFSHAHGAIAGGQAMQAGLARRRGLATTRA